MEELLRFSHIKAQANKRSQLTDFNASIFQGEIISFLGLHGSGKRRLIDLLLGKGVIDSGEIYINEEITSFKTAQKLLREFVCHIDSKNYLVENMSVIENLFFIRKTKKLMRIKPKKAALIEYNRIMKIFDLDISPVRKISDLTMGERKLICILKAYIENKKIILVNCVREYYGEQEMKKIKRIFNVLKKEKRAIIIIDEKYNDFISVCDRLIFMKKGCDSLSLYLDHVDGIERIVTMGLLGKAEYKKYLKTHTLFLQGKNKIRIYEENNHLNCILGTGSILGLFDTYYTNTFIIDHIRSLQEKYSLSIFLQEDKILFDEDIRKNTKIEILYEGWRKQLFDKMTIAQNIAFYMSKRINDKQIYPKQELIAYLEAEFKRKFKISSSVVMVRQLSYGERKLLVYYCLALLNPRLILVDNPVYQMDAACQKNFEEFTYELRQRGIAIIIRFNNWYESGSICNVVLETQKYMELELAMQ